MQSPSTLQYKNILAIGAHPDDIEFGCFGFLLKQRKSGAKVSAFIGSLGSKGDPSTGTGRRDESSAALSLLPAETVIFREREGLEPHDFHEVLQSLYDMIQQIKPDLILTLSPHDTHPGTSTHPRYYIGGCAEIIGFNPRLLDP